MAPKCFHPSLQINEEGTCCDCGQPNAQSGSPDWFAVATEIVGREAEQLRGLATTPCLSCAVLLKALVEISKGEGAFSRDRLTHAENVIRRSQELAHVAIRRYQERS